MSVNRLLQRLLRRSLPLLVLLGLGAAVVTAPRTDTAARLGARGLETVVEALTGEETAIARVELGYFPPRVRVRGLRVTHPGTRDLVASARTIEVAFGREGLAATVDRITLDQPFVHLHVDHDGLREFRGVRPGEGGGGTFRWPALAIHGGTVLVEAGASAVQVGGIDLVPEGERADLRLRRVELRLPANTQVAHDVHVPDLLLSAEEIAAPHLDLQFPALGVEGGVSLPASGPLSGALSAWVNLGDLTVPAAPATWFTGRVQADAELAGTRAAPELAGLVAIAGFAIQEPEEGRYRPVRFGDVLGPWSLRDGHFHLEHATMDWAQGALDLAATVRLADGHVEGAALAEGVRFTDIMRDTGVAPTAWVDFRADVEAHVAGSVSPLLLQGPFEVALTDLEVGDGPVRGAHDTLLAVPRGSVGGELTITGRHLVLDARDVHAGPSQGRALADIGFSSHGPLRVDVDLPVLDLSWLAPLGDIELDGLASVQGSIGGPYDALAVDGVVDAEGFVVLGLPLADTVQARVESDLKRLVFTEIDARNGETPWKGAYTIDFSRDNWMEADVQVAEGRLSDLTGIFVDLGDVDGAVNGTLSLAGTPYDLDGEARFALSDIGLYGERFTEGSALGWMQDGEFLLDHLQLRRPHGTLRARGSVRKGWAMNMEVLSDGLTLETLDHLAPLGLPLTGDLTLDARVGGTLFDWRPEGRLAVRDTRYGEERLADSTIRFETVDLAPDAPGVAWRGRVLGAAAVVGELGYGGEQPYTLQAELAGFPLHFFYPRGVDGSPVLAEITGAVDLAGHFGDAPSAASLHGTLAEVLLRWDDHELRNEAPWSVTVAEREVDIPRLQLQGTDGTRLSLEGRVGQGGRVELSGGGEVNLDLARAVTPGLLEAEGMGRVQYRFTPEDRVVTLALDEARLVTSYWTEPFEALTGTITARPDGYTFTGVEALVGGGTFEGLPSRIEAKDWVPTRYELAARIDHSRTRYVDALPPMVLSGSLAFDGPAQDPLLSGALSVDELLWTERIDWEAMVLSLREERLTVAAPEETERWFSMDLAVKADGTIRLDNNVADADASADLRLVGDTSRPGMTGDVVLAPGGRVYLHEREFEVARGEIRYLDPYTWDPDLDVVLETDVRSAEQDYHVDYRVSGPFSDWRTTTTADPYLAQADVNALLLFGVTREELDRYGGANLGTALLAETGDLLLGQTALTRANPIVDRWSLVSGVTERGSTTVSSDVRLVAEKRLGEFDLTFETSLGQGLGEDWYVSLERRIAQRLYATTYAATRQEGRSLPIGAAYGVEFKFRWELD